MRDLLGGKGANLAEMAALGLPVPPGFTITTEACNEYFKIGKQFPENLWNQALAALAVALGVAGCKPAGDAAEEKIVTEVAVQVGKVTKAQIREIAEKKIVDLNCASIESAMSMIEGSARAMGLQVVE